MCAATLRQTCRSVNIRRTSPPEGSALALLHERGELRDDRVEVADDAQVAELEDGRVAVLVDRDDHLRGLHADLVLDRAGHAEPDVDLRRHDLAGLDTLSGV